MAGISPPTRWDVENCKKKMQKGGPGTFWFNKGVAEGFFHVWLDGRGGGGGGGRDCWDHFWWDCTPSACHVKSLEACNQVIESMVKDIKV